MQGVFSVNCEYTTFSRGAESCTSGESADPDFTHMEKSVILDKTNG